jgi:hypothetical protein
MKRDVEIGCDMNDWLKRGALEITALVTNLGRGGPLFGGHPPVPPLSPPCPSSSEEFCGLKNSEEFSVGYSLVKRGLDTFYLLTNKEALIVQVGIYLR